MTASATVRLLNYPLQLSLRSRQHFEELIREFQLVDLGAESAEGPPLPVRLQELVTEITTTYKAKADEIEALRAPAIARGDLTMDLVYDVPTEARPAIERLDSVLEEADEYCRQGEHLLTLATPPEVAEFRRWNLHEVLSQIDGQPPTPWTGAAE
jgi:hypothetical protein